MSPSNEIVTRSQTAVATVSPEQTLKACKALLAHIHKTTKAKTSDPSKKNLLQEDDEAVAETPIWLNLTTKRHIADSNRLKPGKIRLPHSLNDDENTTICLITADPQRAYKDVVASPEFPEALRKRITRVIDYSHLKAKFSQYEAQRKLFSEHDVFLGDDRVINRLPKVLGKTFYRTTTKRPIPVVFQSKAAKPDAKKGNDNKSARGRGSNGANGQGQLNAGSAGTIAAEVERALSSALVHLTPSPNTSIRVGVARFSPEELAANVEAVVAGLVEKWVPQKWKNVKSIYVKGPETAALPVWLTEELWLEEKDVVAELPEQDKKAIKEKPNIGKKRKAPEAVTEEKQGEEGAAGTGTPAKKAKKEKKEKKEKAALPTSNDEELDKQIAERKTKLKKQKAKAKAALED
ncbi:electron transfer flavo protein alpha-subunit [Sodiomyces alkalinus F11]|uniref:Electron transfer flavo protein alpha-subunit n=1 Tax=Sodiomyces alkalinus (strain CBS 110278 / VKM F-3762 / F11) TaxID=1314773 RepID=A0A3N2Q8T4_SODAK|nr:electron transfer flavo protein alpha-subunit [Sodiomyces alkalinus F11]ROT43035.1 electron transfer flavo protein alpha-subunit [Sodiomyces alkalinus F11]